MTELELEWCENDLAQTIDRCVMANIGDCTNSDGILYWD